MTAFLLLSSAVKTVLAKPPFSKREEPPNNNELVLCVSGNQALATPELILRAVLHNI